MIVPQVLSGRAQRLLDQIARKTKNLTPLFEGPLTNRIHAFFGEIFATEGAVLGSPWAPLAPATLAAKTRVHRANMGILRRYNTLWASLTKRGAPQGVRVVRPDRLIIGTSVPYAAIHQEGRDRVPQRVIVPDELPAKESRAWESLLARYLERVR